MTHTLILGAGIGGLAAALALHRHGIKARVFEQAAELGEIGAGIQISPNGAAVLRALGLGDVLGRAGVQPTQVRLINGETGRDVARLPMAGRDYHFLHRADLIEILADALGAAQIPLSLGQKAQSVTGNQVCFETGTETAELIIGADGLNSIVANRGAPQFTGQVAWRALIPAATNEPPEVQLHMGTGRHLVRYPLRGGDLINIVAIEEREAWADEGWHQKVDPSEIAQAFARFSPAIRADLDRIETAHLWGLHLHPVAETWASDHQALLGDAAHPMLPFLAQGANMALEDAWVLADCVKSQSLDQYTARQKPRVTRVRDAAAANARNYHKAPGLKRSAAHTALRLVSSLAPGLLTAKFNWLYAHDVTKS